MYQPVHARFVERSAERLHRLIREFPLGTLVTQSEAGIDANHIPFLLKESSPAKLVAHVPRANPVWQQLADRSVLAVFHGPNAYISPSWYASKQAHGKVVPTWNYAVVHVRGVGRVIQEREWLRAHLNELTHEHERKLDPPWRIDDAPEDYINTLLGSLVGIEIEITDMHGKFKLGQNRPEEDRLSVARVLQDRNPVLNEFGAP